jgi:hypothetical protein
MKANMQIFLIKTALEHNSKNMQYLLQNDKDNLTRLSELMIQRDNLKNMLIETLEKLLNNEAKHDAA